MRLAYDAKRLFCNRTGLGNYSRSLVANLAHTYPALTLRLYTPYSRLPAAQIAAFFHPPFQPCLSTHPIKAWWRSHGIKTDLVQADVDLYHGLSNELPWQLSQTTGIKSVLTIHDLIFKRYPHFFPWMDRQFYAWKCRYSCQQADLILAISESTKKDLLHYYDLPPEKIQVLYQACEASYYDLPPQPFAPLQARYELPDRFILAVGTLEPRKNLSLLFRAHALLPKALQLPLVVVGRGQLPAGISSELPLHWLDQINTTSALQALYQKAACLVYPSLYEGFGLPIVEALLCRTPVVAAQSSSLPEAGGPHSLYVDPTDAQACANAIARVLTEPNVAAAMREKGYAYAQATFHPDHLSAQLMAHYERLFSLDKA
jgi:glycosyltransferase involved in cell wall biosynthesis